MRQRLFNDVEVFFQRGDRRFDFRHVAQLWRGADQAPKTMVKAGTMVEVVQSIHFSAAARACRSCG